ncbi:MAG: hypothetical protein M3Q81_02890 [bacterium]|nr:hypothetical protein [bacterium]
MFETSAAVTACRGLVIDIDDTLADTSLATASVLEKEFTETACVIQDVLLQYGYPNSVPFWKSEQSLARYAFILNDHDFLSQIPPTPQAHKGLLMVCDLVPLSFYLTSRPSTMQLVTESWLQSNGFPSAPVVCRQPNVQDKDWKLKFLTQTNPDSYGLIDNEIHVPDDLQYKGKILELIRHKKMSPPNPQIISCKSWLDIATLISDDFPSVRDA